MNEPYTIQRKEAMDKQMKLFATIDTWELIPRPADKLVLTSKWVYKIKKKLNELILYKAR